MPPKSPFESQHVGGYNSYRNFYEFVQITRNVPSAAWAQRKAVTCAVRNQHAKIRHP